MLSLDFYPNRLRETLPFQTGTLKIRNPKNWLFEDARGSNGCCRVNEVAREFSAVLNPISLRLKCCGCNSSHALKQAPEADPMAPQAMETAYMLQVRL